MMKFEFNIHGVKNTISLEKSGQGYMARIKERVFSIQASRVDNEFIVLEVDGERYTVFVGENDETYIVQVRGEEYTVKEASSDVMITEGFDDQKREGNIVTAPMPGKVIKILCHEGDSVSSRQTLAIIEAMKMENNIVAHRDAVIKRIMVKEGDQVNLSDPIIELIGLEGKEA